MNSKADEVASLFQEIVLVLGGVFAMHPVTDEAVQRIARGLERAYRRPRQSDERPDSPARPHPALRRLLQLARASRRGK